MVSCEMREHEQDQKDAIPHNLIAPQRLEEKNEYHCHSCSPLMTVNVELGIRGIENDAKYPRKRLESTLPARGHKYLSQHILERLRIDHEEMQEELHAHGTQRVKLDVV